MSTDLAIIESVGTLNAVTVFAPGGVDDVLAKLKAEVRAIPTDISTANGRSAVASLAYKVSRSKTALDALGKNLTADMKAQTSKIDAERRKICDELDALRDEVRKPLDDFEAAEAARIEGFEAAIEEILKTAIFLFGEPGSNEISSRLNYLAMLPSRDWQEFSQRAMDAMGTAKRSLESLLAIAVWREEERAELERLRAEKAEADRLESIRLQAEREERLAHVAAERARIAAEEKARRDAEEEAVRVAAEKKAVADKAEAERLSIQRELIAAEERALQAERDRQIAENNACIAAENAQRQAEIEKQRAIDAERKRVANEQSAAVAEQCLREQDKVNKTKIHGEILAVLKANAMTDETAKQVIVLIAKGLIPHVSISY